MIKKIGLVLVLLAVVSCAGPGRLGRGSRAGVTTSNVNVAQSGELPPPTRTDLFEQNRPYLIGPFDKLVIDVFGIEDLSEKEVQTDSGGRISFPLAGIIEAAGKTPEKSKILSKSVFAAVSCAIRR